MATLSAEVLQDDLALKLAQVLAAANKRARELGVDVLQSLVSMTQSVDHGPAGGSTMIPGTTSGDRVEIC